MPDTPPSPPVRRKHKTQRPPLSAQDIRFARLLFDRGTKSVVACYLEAGFPVKETEIATKQSAYRRVKNQHFRNYYRNLQNRAADASQLDANMVVQGLMRIAFANRADLFDRHGCLLPKHLWPVDVAATVEGIESEELYEVVSEKGQPKRKELRGHTRKVKTAGRTEALKMLATMLNLLGRDADAGKPPPAPLVVGGEASPESL